MSQTGWRIAVILGGAFCALIGRAEAQEYCIACTQPNAVYRCIIDGARPGGQPLQMMCVTAMLKEGQHSTCAPKGGTVFDCNGPVKRVPWAAHNASALPAPKPQAATPPAKASSDQPPRTVEEMAKRANEKTAEDLKKTDETIKDQTKAIGQNLGDATKKTWQCVTTLFSRCGD